MNYLPVIPKHWRTTIKFFSWIFFSLYYLSVLFYLTGCASTVAGVTKGTLDKIFEDDPPVLDATYEASPKLNPDIKGEPSPLVVRMYELKSLTEFNAAEFFPLYKDAKDVLGDDLVAFEENEILPDEKGEIKKELNIETRYIGILGAYRDIEHAAWRASVETPLDETTKVVIKFDTLSIAIDPRDD
jgi:type VI secretion system protein VasD